MNGFEAGNPALFSAVSCPFRDASQIRRVPAAGGECVSRNAKQLMLRSKSAAFLLMPTMPHCTNRFELYRFCAYPPRAAQSLPAAYGIGLGLGGQ